MPKGTSEQDAAAVEARMMHTVVHNLKTQSDQSWIDYVDRLVKCSSWLDQALAKAVYRAKLKGMRCTISRETLAQAMYACNGRCQITGLAFNDTVVDGRSRRPFRHSVDRIDSSRGYLPDNIRIVCTSVNVAMMHWGEDLFGKLAVGYVLQKYSFFAQLSNISEPKSFNQENSNTP